MEASKTNFAHWVFMNIASIGLVFLLTVGCGYLDSKRKINDLAYMHDTTLVTAIQDAWWKKEARIMVQDQILSRGIRDSLLLRTLEETPRHLFVPEKHRHMAYADRALPIQKGQTISQPYIVALMTDLLDLEGNERVLEIGTGSGYQAAILSQLVDSVYTIEIVKSLAASSKVLLSHLGYNNVVVRHGDGYIGWEEKAPFDCIILTAAPGSIPVKLTEQLKVGGLMVLPVGRSIQRLKVITKDPSGKLKERTEARVRFVPMIHAEDTL